MTATQATTTVKTYHVEGMTCTSCAAKVQSQLEALPEVASARVDKATDTATVELAVPTGRGYLQGALDAKYVLVEPEESKGLRSKGLSGQGAPAGRPHDDATVRPVGLDLRPLDLRPTNPSRQGAPTSRPDNDATVRPVGLDLSPLDLRPNFFQTYRPLLTIVGLIALVTVLAEASSPGAFDARTWMRLFMAGFFVVFAGFKLLDVRGFSDSYRMYDVVAERLPIWGLLYPFVELGLGLAYLTDVAPFWTNVVTIVVLGVSAIGVIQTVLDKRAIRCACLGTGFNLPMSTVTIVEDVGMVAMAAAMLAWG